MEIKTDNVIYHVPIYEDFLYLVNKLDELGCRWRYGCVDCESRAIYEEYTNGIPIVTYEKPIEKPLIPEYVADWLESCKNKGLSLGYVLYNSNYADKKMVRRWLGTLENQPIFAHAWVDGYGIEKQQVYKIPLKGLITSDGEQQFLTGKYGKYYASRKNVNLKQTFDRNELDNNVPKWCRGFAVKV